MANEVKNEQIVNETAPVENKTEVKAEAKDVRHSNKPANKSDKYNRFAKNQEQEYLQVVLKKK